MLTKISKLLVVAVFGLIVSGCANSDFSHDYLMRGQVITASSDNVVVCVGTSDGAEVGQVLTAYRFVMNDDNDEGAEFFKRVNIGQVKINKIIDEHFAKVTVLKGKIKRNDMVQLNK